MPIASRQFTTLDFQPRPNLQPSLQPHRQEWPESNDREALNVMSHQLEKKDPIEIAAGVRLPAPLENVPRHKGLP